MNPKKIVKLLVLSLILFANAGHAEEVSIPLDSSVATTSQTRPAYVPPGFEELLEPQTTLVDIYYGNQFLAASLATFTVTEITFLEPEKILDSLPALLSPEKISSILSQPMPTNSEMVCLRKEDRNCGTLEPDSVEIIFDDSRFRADLFIAPELISVQSTGIEKYLPPSDAGFSFLHTVSAAGTGSSIGERNYNVSNTTIFSYAENRLFTRGNATRTQGYTVDTLALQRDFHGVEYQLGYFRIPASNLVFITESEFRGASIGSSLDTRMDLDQSTGSELQLFLDSRSRVDIYKDDRLVSTGVYDTGNQVIDTRELPSGAYDVKLLIRDNFGRVKEETRFYIKSNRLPPINQTLFFIDAGELVTTIPDQTLPETTGASIVRAGISRRLSRSFGAETGILSLEDESIMEAGFFNIGRIHEMRVNLSQSRQGDRGVNLNSRLRLGPVTWSLNYRKTWLDPESQLTGTSLLGDEVSQISSVISSPIKSGLLNITSRYNKRTLSFDKYYGIRYNLPAIKFSRDALLNLSLEFSKSKSEELLIRHDETLLLFTASIRFGSGRWQMEAGARPTRRETDNQSNSWLNPRLSAHWTDGDKYDSDVALTLRARDEQDIRFLETEFEAAGRYGRSTIDIQRNLDTSVTQYGVNLFTTLLANGNSFGVGGKSITESALILDVSGQKEDAWFDIMVNNTQRGRVSPGNTAIINLRPFDTYAVSLHARGSTLLDYNHQQKSATLYPGNVVTMKWEAKKIIVIFGQLIDINDQPVTNAIIKGVFGLAITDEFGMFQAEIDTQAKTFTARNRQFSCSFEIPDIDSSKEVVLLDEIRCQ
ncbi:MAG: CS1-pili formation C-terminal domain-containing protein [Gammaproteobacteria bacterium]|nr:CS1-pili formation C-terminal domain-containing protein [Gammaproteobacteria bacterium]